MAVALGVDLVVDLVVALVVDLVVDLVVAVLPAGPLALVVFAGFFTAVEDLVVVAFVEAGFLAGGLAF